MRLGYLACIASLVACAQGIESPGTENLTNATDLGGASSSLGGGGSGNTGNVASAGSPVTQAGAPSSSAGSSSAGSTSAGSSSGGSSSGGSSGSSSAGSSGAAAAGAGPTSGMCGHFQPGNMGPTLESKLEPGTDAIYFSVKIANPDDREVHLSDLKFRYYVDTGALGTLMSDFYQKDITAVSKVTRQLAAEPTATVSADYLEFSFPGSGDIIQTGEFLTLKIHTHNSMFQAPNQASAYSYNSSTAFVPWCKIVLYEIGPIAWGTLPP